MGVVLFHYNYSGINIEKDGFTFQAIIESNGNILFHYKKIPYNPTSKHVHTSSGLERKYPLVIGLEDAVKVPMEETKEDAEEKYKFLDYAPLRLNWTKIEKLYQWQTGVTVLMTPTNVICLQYKSCQDCASFSATNIHRLKCGCCEETQECVDPGRERARLTSKCLRTKNGLLTTAAQCNAPSKSANDSMVLERSLSITLALLIGVCCGLLCCTYRHHFNPNSRGSKVVPST